MKNQFRNLSTSLLLSVVTIGMVYSRSSIVDNNSPTISAVSSSTYVINKNKFKKVKNFAQDNPTLYRGLIASVRNEVRDPSNTAKNADDFALNVLGGKKKIITDEIIKIGSDLTLTEILTGLDLDIQKILDERKKLEEEYNHVSSGSSTGPKNMVIYTLPNGERFSKELYLEYLANQIAKLDEQVKALKDEYNLLAGKDPVKEGEEPTKEGETAPTEQELAALQLEADKKLALLEKADQDLTAKQAERNALLAKDKLSESEQTKLDSLQTEIPNLSRDRELLKSDYASYVEENSLISKY